MTVVVIGQIARDLILRTAGPESTTVVERHELLGGKGANQAVGLRQLGVPVALVGVAGDDAAGDMAVEQAAADGIDVRAVVRRGQTALLIDIVDEPPHRRLLEHVPDMALLTTDDITRCSDLIGSADTVSIQLQQPAGTVLAAARAARGAGARVVLDGAVDSAVRDEVLALCDVLRADADEADILAGRKLEDASATKEFGADLLRRGPGLVALEVRGEGDLVMWRGGARLLPRTDDPVVDPTGAGDAFVAGLIAGLRRGDDPERAAELATSAARQVVGRLGGRPDLRGL